MATTDLNRAINLKFETAEDYFERGLANLNGDFYTDSITDFNQAIEIKPDYPEAYYYRGLAYEELKNKDTAIDDFRKVLELSTDSVLRQQAQDQLKALGAQ